MADRNKKLLADDAIIFLSDEQSASDEEEKVMLIDANEPNGPASISEAPGEMDILGGGAG